ncbi:MAG: sodium-dependent transporter [Chitinophagaceae bacterium]|nr:sodium-dependent transporter [Chitinophagaceae bacterium]
MSSRGTFSNKFGFIMAAAGSAVGLGNIWGFPFKAANGGGAAFLFIYILCCFILCFPVMITEISIGRNTTKNAIGAFPKLGFPKWRFVGFIGVFCGVMILSFYNVVASWAFGYFLNLSIGNFEIGNHFADFTKDIYTIIIYAFIFMFITGFIISKGVTKGIEQASKIMMPTLFAILIGLVLYSLTLPNAVIGVSYYLIPDFSEVSISTIYIALGQAFFSLSLGMGMQLTYGSYVNKADNIVSSAMWITLTDLSVAFLAGFMMFPIIAYMNNGDMSNVTGGPGLIFVTLPGVFETLGTVTGSIVGSLFFLLLCFAALTSTISLLEVPVAWCVDELKMNRSIATWGTALIIFILGIPCVLANGYSDFWTNFITYGGKETPTDYLSFVNDFASELLLPLGGTIMTFFAAYIWKTKNMNEEICLGYPNYKGSFVELFLNFTVKYFCPVILFIIFIFTILNKFFGITIF